MQLRSSGPLAIHALDAPSILRVALSARRPHPGDALVAVAAALLVSRLRHGETPPPATFDPDAFRTRIFTLESADDTGFAEGTLDTLYRLEIEAA